MKRLLAFLAAVSFVFIASRREAGLPQKALPEPTRESVEAAKKAAETWSNEHRGASDLSELELIGRLAAIEDIDLTAKGKSAEPQALKPDEMWRTANHVFGFIAAGSGVETIQNAFSVDSDPALRGSLVKITLDRMRVMKYPGKGTHDILFDFYGQTQSEQEITPVSFSVGVIARDTDEVASIGKPIIIGLAVGSDGIDLKCRTINVTTKEDQTFFSILGGQVFSQGLNIVNAFQPAIKPLTALISGLVKKIGDQKANVPVQRFDIGLDFSKISTHIRVREGSYIAVQIPPSQAALWQWDEWTYTKGRIHRKDDERKTPEYNYVVISISRLESPIPAGTVPVE